MKTFQLSALLAISSFSLGAHAVSSAEFYTGQGYPFGRFEARIRFAPGDGVISSFFLWKNGSEVTDTFWAELDFEKVGADCHLETNARYGNPADNHGKPPIYKQNLCDQFHTYTYEWTPDYISWLVDGEEVRRETGDAAAAFAQNTPAGMQLRFNIWPGDSSFGGTFNASSMPLYEYINWVQYSAYNNGIFEPKWRQDFTTGPIPTGWSAGNWGSPKNLSNHSPRNVGFADGNVVLALTADDALGTAGASAIDVNDPSPVGGAGGMTSTSTSAVGGGSAATGGQASASNETNSGDGGGGCSTSAGSTRGLSSVATLGLILGAISLFRRRRS